MRGVEWLFHFAKSKAFFYETHVDFEKFPEMNRQAFYAVAFTFMALKGKDANVHYKLSPVKQKYQVGLK